MSSTKPTYLGLLNAISNAEGAAECYLDAWVAVCGRDDVRQVLYTVARREGEHAKSFAKRICELGFEVVERPDPGMADRLAIASSTDLTDREKFEKLGVGQGEVLDKKGRDIFARMMDDVTIDIATGTLLGRYIAEERDSGRLLRGCYQALCAEECSSEASGDDSGSGVEQRLARLEERIEELCARLG
ncbi:MAG: hypothetical protein R2705_08090 [Ilumatobacteraceae bacterium]